MLRRPPFRLLVASLLLCALSVGLPAQAMAVKSSKKSIWGPVRVAGANQFPIYQDLGVGIFQQTLAWSRVATRRPRNPRNPNDPAYRWPADTTFAVEQAPRHGIRVMLQLATTPRWANGNRARQWAPNNPQDFADFAAAAAARYDDVRLWMVWGEPTRRKNFRPLERSRGRSVSARQRRGPRRYAQILDAAYGVLKEANSGNTIIGGNSFSSGDISPHNWIRSLRLPNGRRPRMDLYGHNPFTARRPNLSKPPLGRGFADFSDLDTLAGWLDSNGFRRPNGSRLRLFLSEFFLPTNRNQEFNFHVTPRTAATWLRDAIRITRNWSRIHSLGWFSLYDDPPQRNNRQVHRGLLDHRGRKKPAYGVFKRWR